MQKSLAINGGKPVRNRPFTSWPVTSDEECSALVDVYKSGVWGSVAGSRVHEFERDFAAYHDAKYGIAVVNGTVALKIALMAAGVGEGDEVIVPPYTFLATASAVVEANAVPVFVDIEPDTYCIDPKGFEEAITERTKAVIVVHLAGLAADMDRIMAIAGKHGIVVIEDAAHAHGGTYGNRKLGSIGDMACFSFQSSKNMTSGEGGIIITNNKDYADKCWSIHNCGRTRDGAWYAHYTIGGNYRMTEFQGAILGCQMKKLSSRFDLRAANADYLDTELAKIPGIKPLNGARPAGTMNARHLYIFRYDEFVFGVPRSRFISALTSEGIPSSEGYPLPLYEQPLFTNKEFGPYTGYLRTNPDIDYGKVFLPVTERACKSEGCWIPQNVLLGDTGDMDDIVSAVSKIYEYRSEL
ncbi:MAG: DegT/DnrJ/EryC1/StrS family aminotransferase [Armatimonadota bacterium]